MDYAAVARRFGEPKQIALDYVNETETDELLNGLKEKNGIIRIALIAAVIAVALWAAFVATSYVSFEKDMNGYMVIDVIEVERKTIDEGGQ